MWKVVVKVHHKWSIVSNNKKHFEMIVIDKEVSFFTDFYVYFDEVHASFVVLKWLLLWDTFFRFQSSFINGNHPLPPTNLLSWYRVIWIREEYDFLNILCWNFLQPLLNATIVVLYHSSRIYWCTSFYWVHI